MVRRSPIQIALVEFVMIFVTILCWNFVRKTGESVLDSFGVAAVTAVLLLYFWKREHNPYKSGP